MKAILTFSKAKFAWIALCALCLSFVNCREANKTEQTDLTSIAVEDDVQNERDTLVSHPQEIHHLLVR